MPTLIHAPGLGAAAVEPMMSVELGMVLGLACVAWTTLELSRMRKASQRVVAGRGNFGMPRSGPRVQRFAAWDESGRPVAVEDLGHP